ncbi:hypothetical protein GCM10023322_07670 [Rugosimonospora acidiphila]|uniref:Protein kinase domain-containing protein n=1 Tax=Rugosimonospora acidiphila TaxID=556531 RepID=A0ABP9RJL2_9ACTN
MTGPRAPGLRRAGWVLSVSCASLSRTTLVSVIRVLRRRGGSREVWCEDTVALLARLGPSFIKFGQLLSTRRDLLPEDWCEALSRLTRDVPAPPAAEIAVVLGVPDPTVTPAPYAFFDWAAVASGSIASVHRARLPDGRRVAVKVRRPGIDTAMRADLALMRACARLAGGLPGLRRIPVRQMVGQVADAVLRQLDFVAERRALGELAANFRDDEAVRVPAVFEELCTPDLVVMEYVPGLVRYRPDGLDRDRRAAVVARTLRAVYRMLFLDGLVHCDLHPGNLYLTADAGIVVLDAGFVVRLSDRVRRLFAGFFLNMALGRGPRCADIVIESASMVDDRCDLPGFRAAIVALVEEASGTRAADFDLARFAGRLFSLQRRYGLYAAAEFVFPLLCLLVVEGMVNEFDAGVDFQALAIPVLLESLVTPIER